MPNALALSRFDNLWQEVDHHLYNQLPIYLTKQQSNYIPYYSRWGKLLNPAKWTPNMGTTMRGVHKERSPILRSQYVPNTMQQTPRKDVIEVRETSEDVQLYRHDFESQLFHFLPSFQDFLTDHVDFNNKDIAEKITVFDDQFYRTAIFHGAPYVWCCGNVGNELQAVPYWTSPTVSLSKNQATLQALLPLVTGPLNLRTVAKLCTVMENDIGATFFSGSRSPDGSDGSALKGKYCLLCGSEVWDYFSTADAYMLGNKSIDLDIVTGAFKGSLFGRVTTMHERFELRIAADGTVPAPETIEEGANAYNRGETIMLPNYVNAQVGVAFLIGGEAYKRVPVGPPPKDWNGTTLREFYRLDWNGKVDITNNVLIPGEDSAGNYVLDTNKRGEYLQLIASLAMGCLPIRRRNIVPILYLRTRINTQD